MTPTGVYKCSRGVPRVFVPSRTLLGVCYMASVGIDSVRSIEMASDGQSHGTGSSRYPAFRMCSDQMFTNLLALGYQSEHLLLNDGK